MRKTFLILMLLSAPAFAWEGVDSETGDSVEISRGNLVRPGRDIEIYDWGDNRYKDVEVQSIKSRGNRIDVEVFDYETQDYRTLEMKKR